MTAESVSAVLHITAAAGGGVDRYIRDLAANPARPHLVLHVGSSIDVLEDIATGQYIPLRDIAGKDADDAGIARWLRAAGIGIAHLHGLDEGCRARLGTLVRSCELPYVVTLHDLQFVNPRAFEAPGMPEPDPECIAEVGPVLERAATVIAPSEFILDVALACAPGVCATVVPPGIRVADNPDVPATPADFAERKPRHTVAVVGAIGPHKGSGVLDGLAAALVGSEIAIVVIGYLDTRLTRGWLVPDGIYVHGPYRDDALAGWLAAYEVEVVLFPNRLPESFSYTLSEVWATGLPVIVPDHGALGERVASHDGGWRLPAGFEGDEAAALLVWLSSAEGAAERARVKSRISPGDAQRIPLLETMSRDIDALYERFALPSTNATDANAAREALAPLLAANLDGFAFRKELLNLAGELEHARDQFTEAQEWSAKLERDGAAWAAKLETDIAALKSELERLGIENRDLADYKSVLDRFPQFVRDFLLKRVHRARR
jgi:glycosyltransferase involved in cell wall biosynthesis